MAPEQAGSAQVILPATDVYALGVIFYECLAGKVPFNASHLAGVLARILFDAETPIQSLRPSVPEPWAALLVRMMSKDPASRPRDAAALCALLAKMPSETHGSETLATAEWSYEPPSTRESGEQTLACVVLVMFPEGGSAAAPARSVGAPAALHDTVRSALVRFGFQVDDVVGASFLATLSSNGVATDLARIAARGALHARELWPEARIALATGRALSGQGLRVGEAVDRAALLLESHSAHAAGTTPSGSGVWIDTLTAGLLDARFVTSLEGDGVLLSGERPDPDESRLLLGKPTPCVGREVELVQLEGLMARAVEDSAAQAALVVAPPGAGKSRLRHELLRRLRSAHPHAEILIGHGDPLTAGSPYGILGGALRQLAGVRAGDAPAQARAALMARLCRRIPDADARRVAEFMGELCGVPFPDESPPLRAARSDPRVMSEQITQAFVDWITAECAAEPVVLILEDLQWGDALTVKLAEDVLRDADVPASSRNTPRRSRSVPSAARRARRSSAGCSGMPSALRCSRASRSLPGATPSSWRNSSARPPRARLATSRRRCSPCCRRALDVWPLKRGACCAQRASSARPSGQSPHSGSASSGAPRRTRRAGSPTSWSPS
ncbi:AAA family ATPase [Chondromyces apiculatus]|uniref:AAA family ATPase n=1 Tax=Chondromyces apiculatus TaxID=51 RepID=UPI0005C51FEA|nr:AAA family ATPase [Chondromyces apiculatus]